VLLNTSDSQQPRYAVAGIASRTYGEYADCSAGSIETRVDAWRPWIDQQMTEGCRSNERAWCDVEGIIPPGWTAAPTDEQDAEAASGCSLTPRGTSPGQASLPLLLLLLALLVVRGLQRVRGLSDHRS
jgi:hypothetical protein